VVSVIPRPLSLRGRDHGATCCHCSGLVDRLLKTLPCAFQFSGKTHCKQGVSRRHNLTTTLYLRIFLKNLTSCVLQATGNFLLCLKNKDDHVLLLLVILAVALRRSVIDRP
jgi:hypothetical protein